MLAIGAGLGLLAGIDLSSGFHDGAIALIPVLALAYGGIGAGVGAGLDALVSSDQVIFARGGATAKATVRPILRTDRTGVRVSFAF